MRRSLVLFFLAAGVPFAVAVAVFLWSHWPHVVTDPVAYARLLRREGPLDWSISTTLWKQTLARDPSCAEADTVVIGSSRTREVGAEVLGTPAGVCNLYVNNLTAPVFARITEALPAARGGRRVAYVGIDHFFFWREPDDRTALAIAETSLPLWRAYSVLDSLGRLTLPHLATLRQPPAARFDDETILHYVNGEAFHPRYYASKRAGRFSRIASQRLVTAILVHFQETASAGVRPRHVEQFEEGLARLRRNGYEIRLFWNPLVSPYYELARRSYPHLLEAATEAVEDLAARGAVDRYAGSRHLDATSLGCTERDYLDAHHVDIDCLRKFFTAAFDVPAWTGSVPLSEMVATMRSQRYAVAGSGALLQPPRGGP
ncbi:MAG: hypothetical protein ACREM3_03650 [Candidatus Rokuibacteriota bacterium]